MAEDKRASTHNPSIQNKVENPGMEKKNPAIRTDGTLHEQKSNRRKKERRKPEKRV